MCDDESEGRAACVYRNFQKLWNRVHAGVVHLFFHRFGVLMTDAFAIELAVWGEKLMPFGTISRVGLDFDTYVSLHACT